MMLWANPSDGMPACNADGTPFDATQSELEDCCCASSGCCAEDPAYDLATWSLYAGGPLSWIDLDEFCAAHGPGTTYYAVTFNGVTRYYENTSDVEVTWNGDYVDPCTWLHDHGGTGGGPAGGCGDGVPYCQAGAETRLCGTDGSCFRAITVTAPGISSMTVTSGVCS